MTIRLSRLPVWPLFILTSGVVALENVADFRLSVPYMLKASGGLPILDMRLWYTSDQAYQLFDSLGSAGRADYRLLFLTVDIVIPFLVSLLLWSAISRGALRKFRGFALLGGAFDYLENITIIILLANYPERLNNLVTVAACFTLLKSFFYVSGAALAVIGYLIKMLASKKETAMSRSAG